MSWLWPNVKFAALKESDATSGSDEAQVPTTPTMTSPSAEAAKGLKRKRGQMYIISSDPIGNCTY